MDNMTCTHHLPCHSLVHLAWLLAFRLVERTSQSLSNMPERRCVHARIRIDLAIKNLYRSPLRGVFEEEKRIDGTNDLPPQATKPAACLRSRGADNTEKARGM